MKFSEGIVHEYPVAANAVIRVGAFVTVDANGFAIEMPNATNQRHLGVATEHVDNTGGANGARTVTVLKRGVITATASTPVPQTAVGTLVYADGYDAPNARPRVHTTASGRTAVGTVATAGSNIVEVYINTV